MSYNKTIGAFFSHQDKSTLESDVHLGFASLNITVVGLTNPDVNLKRMHQLYNVPIGFHSAGGNTICTAGTLYVLHDLFFRNAICTTLLVTQYSGAKFIA